MRWGKTPDYMTGTTRTRDHFLFWPKRIQGEWRWFERTSWEERLSWSHSEKNKKEWVETRWTDSPRAGAFQEV